VITEDKDTGKVPARLASYVFPESELAAIRTRKWSSLNLIGQALEVRRLQYGTSFSRPRADEIYVVESCLRVIREYGARLFFALNLSLSPPNGYSFTDGVDLQLEAVDFARSLPQKERDEWLKFLNTQFTECWLDEGAKHYHAKLRSGRPDSDEAQLSEFLPLHNSFNTNIKARMTRAEPVAEFRVAFPSMFSAESVALPGTAAASTSRNANGGNDGNTNGNNGGKKDKGKGKGNPSNKRPPDSGPGSKSKLAMPLSAAELWLGGVVFKLDYIAQHYKVQRPDHVCWPALLTEKKGDEALAICPDHTNHGDLKAVVHKRPSGFDLDYIYKHFTRGATPEENKKANWTPPNKKSKKP